MELNCEGCAGCCVDWRSLAGREFADHERGGRYRPLDDVYNLVPLTRSDARAFLADGLADALTPRIWRGEAALPTVEVDGVPLAAIDGKPVFFLGLRKPPKPVAPFGREAATWLPACVFLDPETLQCRIHGSERYPEECADYPGHNLALDAETECERVESTFGGERLVDDEPPDDRSGLLLGRGAIGEKVFVHPDPDRLSGVVDRVLDGELTAADRAEFVAAAVAGTPGSPNTDRKTFEEAYETALDARSWVSDAVEEWSALADAAEPDPGLGRTVETARGAPDTPGWG